MRFLAVLILAWLAGGAAQAEEIRMIGNSVMFSGKTILSNVIDSRNHNALVRAMKAVGLEQPLMRKGNYTLFAPTDAAFAALPKHQMDRLVTKPSRDEIARVLACHIVADDVFAGRKLRDLSSASRVTHVQTIGGCELSIVYDGQSFMVSLANGAKARITDADILQKNGMVQIIDAVLIKNE